MSQFFVRHKETKANSIQQNQFETRVLTLLFWFFCSFSVVLVVWVVEVTVEGAVNYEVEVVEMELRPS